MKWRYHASLIVAVAIAVGCLLGLAIQYAFATKSTSQMTTEHLSVLDYSQRVECAPESAGYAAVADLAQKSGYYRKVYADALWDLKEQLRDCIDRKHNYGNQGGLRRWTVGS